MNKSIFFRIVMALVLLGAMIGLAIFAYQAGIAQGLAQGVAQGAQVEASKAPTVTIPYYGYPFGPHFMGFGVFGLLGCLVPLFFICLAFSALRGLLWFGPHRWRMHRHGPYGVQSSEGAEDWRMGVPPFFEEWHRRSHEKPATETTEK